MLQSADSLFTAWADASNAAPSIVETNHIVALPRDAQARFYRLDGRFR